MYANLIVKLASGQELSAWKVTVGEARTGHLLIHLDDPNDESKYATPAGLRSVALAEIDEIFANW